MNEKCRDSENLISKCICGHGQILPIPSEKEALEFYKKDGLKEVDSLMGISDKIIIKQNLIDTKRRLNYIPKGSVLEIGAGFGILIKQLKNKTKVGYEPSIDRQKKSKIKFVNKLPRKKFDTICMFHVLEHIPEPIKFLKRVRKITKKLLIIEIPNGNDYQLKNKKYSDFFWQVAHIHYFTPNSIKMCLESAGFHQIMIRGIQRYTNKTSKITFITKNQVPKLIKNLTCDTLLITVNCQSHNDVSVKT